jgi:hypothetical protein
MQNACTQIRQYHLWKGKCKQFFLDCMTLKVKALSSFETMGTTHQATLLWEPQILQKHCLGSTLICRSILLALIYIILLSSALNKIAYYRLLEYVPLYWVATHQTTWCHIPQDIYLHRPPIRTPKLTQLPSYDHVCLQSTSLPLANKTDRRNIRRP